MKPRKTIIPVKTALARWRDDGSIYQEKLDGRFLRLVLPRAVFQCESMPSGPVAFDCLMADGQDIATQPLRLRWPECVRLAGLAGLPVVRTSNDGPALLRAVLEAGGEGVVRKLPDSPFFEPMEAAKRCQQWLCRVVGFPGASQSAVIVDAQTGEDRGAVPLLGGKVDRCRVGSVIKVEGFGLHASGRIREPRPCKDSPDSWLVAL